MAASDDQPDRLTLREGRADTLSNVDFGASMRRYLRDESGATSIEYALIATLVSMVILGSVTLIGTTVKGIFVSVSSGFSSSR